MPKRKRTKRKRKKSQSPQESLRHRLRWWVSSQSEEITDVELDELERHIKVDEYLSLEYAGNFILTSSLVEREEALELMCCGIINDDIRLDSGRWLYFAFDYGH